MGGHGCGKCIRAGLALAVALTIGTEPALAQGLRHALLIGVGDYIHDGVTDLEGPPHDVRSLERVLRDDWAFDRVTALVDHDATRDAILGALDELIRESRPGDHVFLYFSGHGTSALEGRDRARAPSPLAAALDPGTGGLFPADLDPDLADPAERLLVGRRDLRPRLQQLDRGRDVFVVFDACYSGAAVRSWVPNGTASLRYQPWPTTSSAAFGSATRIVDDRYPYDNLVYLSASAENEAALDIRESDLRIRPTIDNRPHGLLTDAILRGLDGAADTDGSGELTVRELHRYVRKNVEERWQQTPQLLHPEGEDALTERPVFSVAQVIDPAPPSEPSTALRVRLGPGAADLRVRVAALDGVSVVTAAYDLYVEADVGGGFTVRHGSGDVLASALEAGEAERRVAFQALAHELLAESFPGQDFNVELDVLEVTQQAGRPQAAARTHAELFLGGAYEMRYAADVPAYFLLVTVDVHGVMRLLVPWTAQDLDPAREGRIPDLLVMRPVGTEFVKLFAFRERPAGLDRWLPQRGAGGQPRVRTVDSRQELDALLQFVRAHAAVASETDRKFVTAAPAR